MPTSALVIALARLSQMQRDAPKPSDATFSENAANSGSTSAANDVPQPDGFGSVASERYWALSVVTLTLPRNREDIKRNAAPD
jgi:hypothetical protein